ncbi:MAG TPA: hypothetical protein ENN40_11685 [Candidatus Aminicenantes bacterium]|nr:hypothetical protein [Candidatus Aminicenantes bacterium]
MQQFNCDVKRVYNQRVYNHIDVRDYLERLTGWLDRPKTEAEKATDARLERILDKCAAYCRRLYGSSFDFVCIEKVREKLPGSEAPQGYFRADLRPVVDSDTLITEYDYRLVRKDRKIREVRTRIRVNGRKVDEEVVEAPQDHPGVEKIIFGPWRCLNNAGNRITTIGFWVKRHWKTQRRWFRLSTMRRARQGIMLLPPIFRVPAA